MNLEQFLEKRITKEQMEGLNANSKIQKIEGKKDNKLTITLPDELADMIDSDDRGKKILTDNIVKFVRSLKNDLEA